MDCLLVLIGLQLATWPSANLSADLRLEVELNLRASVVVATVHGLPALSPEEEFDAAPPADHKHRPKTGWTVAKGAFFVAHLKAAADLPQEYGWYIFEAATDEGVDPKDLASILISENSGPTLDFSLEGSTQRHFVMDYSPHEVGSEGERGLFQVGSMWAHAAGYKGDDLFDPESSARIAAWVIHNNQERHIEKCESQRYSYHTWIAHYKCAPEERDLFDGTCRFKQKKWHKLRMSLDAVASPDFDAIGHQQEKTIAKTRRKAARDWRRKQRKLKKKLKKQREDADTK